MIFFYERFLRQFDVTYVVWNDDNVLSFDKNLDQKATKIFRQVLDNKQSKKSGYVRFYDFTNLQSFCVKLMSHWQKKNVGKVMSFHEYFLRSFS